MDEDIKITKTSNTSLGSGEKELRRDIEPGLLWLSASKALPLGRAVSGRLGVLRAR